MAGASLSSPKPVGAWNRSRGHAESRPVVLPPFTSRVAARLSGVVGTISSLLLGGGKTIFPSDGRARHLELVSVAQAKTGVLICSYRPVRPTEP
jgi:hypothetical protein